MRMTTVSKSAVALCLGVSLHTISIGANANETRLSTIAHSFLSGCGGAMETGAKQSAACLIDSALPVALDLAEQSGTGVFGERFSITDNLSYDDQNGLRGEIDLLFPLGAARSQAYSGTGEGFNAAPVNALFMQQGATIWLDEDGIKRHDLRLGMAFRFQPWQARSDLFGLSMFQQHNAEYGHSRSVIGVDYAAGPSSEAAFHYYLPTTGWRAAAPGFEEHALEGVELSGRLDLPLSLRLEGATGQWRVPGDAVHSGASRVGLSWQYNRWTELSANWQESEIDDVGTTGLRTGFAVKIPLGGGNASPRSVRNLVRYDGRETAASPGGFALQDRAWRPVEQVGEIRYVRRAVSAPATAGADGVRLEFMQDSAPTGNRIRIKVSLPAPASAEERYLLRLQPGDGDNPAVEGEDFDGAPILVLLNQGERETIVTAELIRNGGMQESRSLGVNIARWSEQASPENTPALSVQ